MSRRRPDRKAEQGALRTVRACRPLLSDDRTSRSAFVLAGTDLVFVPSLFFGNDPIRFYAANGWGTTALMGAVLDYWPLALGISAYRSATRRAPAFSPAPRHWQAAARAAVALAPAGCGEPSPAVRPAALAHRGCRRIRRARRLPLRNRRSGGPVRGNRRPRPA
ncbi:hypothetical protein GCM10010358_24170 [Streptomyces minutiscleroticus]|uniref:Uncharacterized protein n=1 Tax=Streptomyces minutiscleroticus TaxID=68238 RepID=A0A918KM18_9ACTN|nr:hypothetical protein GCM10010358_24170 [Streptomyces minutiscleroticus]